MSLIAEIACLISPHFTVKYNPKKTGKELKMMKSKTLLFFVCLFWVMPASLFAEKMTGNWRLTGYTKYRDAVFVDLARLSSPVPGITAIWIKIAPSTKSKYSQFIREYLDTVQKRNKGFKSIEILCEINCNGHLIRFTRFVYLDNNRKVIHEAHETRPGWLSINQGSVWYPIEKEACTPGK